jgi:sortase (surface protein transpeptidase)
VSAATTTPLVRAGSRLTALLAVSILLAGCGPAERTERASGSVPPAEPAALVIPTALTDEGLNLRAGPVAVPLELLMPSLDVKASVLGVGITPTNVMDAPMGLAEDPVWQQAFWYRGSAVPGAASTALIAGHVGGPHGSPAVFAHLDRLRPGDPIVVRDTRTAVDVRFSVTESKTYSLEQAAEPAVLTRIYGAGPVAGTWPEPSADGLSHLSLITCTGTFRDGTHDHRLVVYATRTA